MRRVSGSTMAAEALHGAKLDIVWVISTAVVPAFTSRWVEVVLD